MIYLIDLLKTKSVKGWYPNSIYIGRCKDERIDCYGNPFIFQNSNLKGIRVNNREEAILNYEKWLRGTDFQDLEPVRRQWILDNLYPLLGKNLQCFCAPLKCHGDVLIQLLKEQLKKDSNV